MLFSNEKFKWLYDINDNKKLTIILFVIFLIPGLPKDFLLYVAGVTPIRPLRFFAILLLGRLPWLFASVSIGASIYYQNYLSIVIISVLALAGLIFGIFFKDKLMKK